jgi:hypothetical protein
VDVHLPNDVEFRQVPHAHVVLSPSDGVGDYEEALAHHRELHARCSGPVHLGEVA